MILLTNGDSWTQGDSPAQTPNWKATKTLDWYDIIPNFGNNFNVCDNTILYKFYDILAYFHHLFMYFTVQIPATMTAVEAVRYAMQKQALGPGNWGLFEIVCNDEIGKLP